MQLLDGPLQEKKTSDSFHYIPFSCGSLTFHLHEIHFVFVMNISDIFSIESKQQSINQVKYFEIRHIFESAILLQKYSIFCPENYKIEKLYKPSKKFSE